MKSDDESFLPHSSCNALRNLLFSAPSVSSQLRCLAFFSWPCAVSRARLSFYFFLRSASALRALATSGSRASYEPRQPHSWLAQPCCQSASLEAAAFLKAEAAFLWPYGLCFLLLAFASQRPSPPWRSFLNTSAVISSPIFFFSSAERRPLPPEDSGFFPDSHFIPRTPCGMGFPHA